MQKNNWIFAVNKSRSNVNSEIEPKLEYLRLIKISCCIKILFLVFILNLSNTMVSIIYIREKALKGAILYLLNSMMIIVWSSILKIVRKKNRSELRIFFISIAILNNMLFMFLVFFLSFWIRCDHFFNNFYWKAHPELTGHFGKISKKLDYF